MTSITVSGLTPARTYQFRVCAVNQVGKGQYSIETSRYSELKRKKKLFILPHLKNYAPQLPESEIDFTVYDKTYNK